MNRSFSDLFSLRKLAGNRRLFLLCLVLFCCSALLSFGWFFPADVVQRRLVKEAVSRTGLQMQGENASMLFPLGLKFDLYLEPNVEQLADLSIKELEITPAWGALLTDNPAVQLDGRLNQGDFSIVADRNGAIDLELNGVDMLPLQGAANDYVLSGKLSGRLLGRELSENFQGQGEFELTAVETHVRGLRNVGLPADIDLGRIQINGKFNRRRVSLEKVVATEGVMELSGGGTFLIGETPEQTRLNLNVRLHPGQKTPESLRSLIQLTGARPTTDGSFLLRIGGTLAKPVVR